jgi:hypothetical protein
MSPATETVEDTRTRPVTDDGDHERFSHYVPKDKLSVPSARRSGRR